jgi:UPF0716 protein FxsA
MKTGLRPEYASAHDPSHTIPRSHAHTIPRSHDPPPMLARLGCLFVVVPLLELALLVQVGRWIGLLPTVGIVAATGLLGAWLARTQGLRALTELQAQTARGQMPAQAMLDGAAILVGGIVLLTPGILSDLLGFALLLPPTRHRLQRWAVERMARGIRSGAVNVTFMGMHGPGWGDASSGSPPGPPRDPEDPPPRPGEIIQR